MFKIKLLLGILFLSCFRTFGQKTKLKIDTTLAHQYWKLAEKKYDASRFDSAILLYNKAFIGFEKAKMTGRSILCKRAEGLSYIDKNEYHEALLCSERALKLSQKYYGAKHIETGACLNNIGLIYSSMGENDLSLNYFRRVLAIYKRQPKDKQLFIGSVYDNMAQVFDSKAEYEKAIEYYRIGLAYRQKNLPKNHIEIANSYNNIALTLNNMGQYDTAVVYYQKAVVIFKANKIVNHANLAMIYNNIGLTLDNLAKYEQSLDYYTQALNMRLQIFGENNESIGESYSNIGNHYDMRGEYEKAIEYRTRALGIIQRAFGEKHWMVAMLYSNMSNTYNSTEQQDKALEYQYKALRINKEVLGEIHPDMAMVYNNIGNSYQYQERYGEALEYYYKALPIYEQTVGKQHTDVAMVLNNIGLIYESTKQYEKALVYQRKALQINQYIFGEKHNDVAMPIGNMGLVFREMQQYDSSLIYCTRAAAIYRNMLGDKNPDVAEAYGSIGETYKEMKQPEMALYYFQKGIIANHHTFADTNIYATPPTTGHLNNTLTLDLLMLKADLLEELYNKQKQPVLLNTALAHLHAADTLIMQVRKTITSTADKLRLNKAVNELCERAIRLHLAQMNSGNINKEHLEKAIYFVENNHASVLREAIAESKAKTFAGLPEDVQQQEGQLKQRLDWFMQQKAEMPADSPEMATLNDSIFAYHARYNDFVGEMEKNYKAYYQLKYQENLPTVAQLQKQLPANSAVLSYFWGDKKAYLSIITPKNYTLIALPTDSLSAREVRAMRNGIIFKENDVYATSAHILYNQLVAPAETFFAQHKEKPKQLFIIPDGALAYIPFEAMLTSAIKPKAVEKPAQWPFLMQRYAVSYFYSTSLLMQNLSEPVSIAPKRYMAMAPVFSEGSKTNFIVKSCERFFDVYRRSDTTKTATGEDVTRAFTRDGRFISPIPATEIEVKEIAGNFQNKNAFARYFLFSDAREEVLKSDSLSKYNYLHLATHGFVNENKPELSGLLLSQDSTNKEDGILYSGEIYNLKLKAELVTLSACETGLGKLVKGEGMIGLTRSFLYAGAKNVMVSLWKVSDNSTSNLMVDFYNQLFDGHNKSVSLQKSKQELIKSGNYSLPYYWAPFVLIGHK